MDSYLRPVFVPAKAASSGWIIRAGFFPTRLGSALAAVCPEGVCALRFVSGECEESTLKAVSAEWPGARLIRDSASIGCLVRRVLGPLNPESCWTGDANQAHAGDPIPLYLKGTDFQHRVWRELMAVLPGEVISYATLANRIGAGDKARAVGQAVGANPVAFRVPCHRIVRADGSLGGYRWGVELKKQLLEIEQSCGVAA